MQRLADDGRPSLTQAVAGHLSLAILSCLILSVPAAAKPASKQSLGGCTKIATDQLRLDCYDDVAGRSRDKKKAANGAGRRNSPEWIYSSFEDEMSGERFETAAKRSNNNFEFPSPYGGSQRARMILRRNGEGEFDVLLSVRKGQFLCSGGCVLEVRFDDDKRVRFRASAPDSHSGTVVLVKNAGLFARWAFGASRVRVRAPFYKTRGPVFNFDLTGLRWEAPKVIPSDRKCRGTFDCPITEKCSKTTKKCVVCTTITEHGSCGDKDQR